MKARSWLLVCLFLAGVMASGQEAGKDPWGRKPSLRAEGEEKAQLDAGRDAALAPPSGFNPITPCRIMDTRPGEGTQGAFGPPSIAGGSNRTIPVTQANCGIPGGATAYSLNITVIPKGPLAFLTAYPTGQARPNVSTLNSFEGSVVANAALVPAGFNGAIDVFVSHTTDVVIDINGYLGSSDSQALRFYTLSPCRLMDTRQSGGKSGAFGPPILAAGERRTIPVLGGGCGVPAGTKAYLLNVTVVPSGSLSYLTVWPAGVGVPLASTLNSFEGRVVANASIVPAGAGGAIQILVTNSAHVIVDVNGYLAP
jgi:hypothetical protein